MSNLTWAALSTCGVFLAVNWLYVLVMAAKAAMERGTLTPYWTAVLSIAAVIGVVLDFVFQFTFGWLMFAETPFRGGLMFSGRVQHHFRHGAGWRKALAGFWARNLNVFDPDHIRP